MGLLDALFKPPRPQPTASPPPLSLIPQRVVRDACTDSSPSIDCHGASRSSDCSSCRISQRYDPDCRPPRWRRRLRKHPLLSILSPSVKILTRGRSLMPRTLQSPMEVGMQRWYCTSTFWPGTSSEAGPTQTCRSSSNSAGESTALSASR